MFMAAPVTFPSTFSVTPHNRTGALIVEASTMSADARTAQGVGQVDIKPSMRTDLRVVLVPDDYVLNSRRAGTQVTSFGPGARQLAAAADGSFAVIYEDTCPQIDRCDIWSRLFDASGAARVNQINQDATDFIVNSSPVNTTTWPSIAQLPDGGLIGGWLILDSTTHQTTNLFIRVFDRDASPLGDEQSVLSATPFDRPPDNLMVAALDRSRFLLVWQQERNNMPGVAEPLYIRGRTVNSGGMLLAEFPVNQDNPPAGMPHADDDHILPYAAAAADGSFVVTWIRGSASCLDPSTTGPCEVRARWFDAAGNPGTEATIPATASMTEILPVATSTGDGYLFVWADKLTTGADPDDYAIRARKFDAAGGPNWPSDAVLNTITAGEQVAPAIAANASGILAVWTDCSARGVDMDDCGIRGRALRPFGLPVGDDFQVNTTTQGRQDNASVVALNGSSFFVAWTDSGTQPPDIDGSVRGRFITPLLDRNDGVVGARCDVAHPCGSNLLCTPHGPDTFCHVECTQVGQPCSTGGVCQAAAGTPGGMSCQYP
jgi:hypothetical protein